MANNKQAPLADRIRPRKLEDFIGQEKARDAVKGVIEGKSLNSIIFWGPPGSGKTTLAKIIAQKTDANFITLSAVDSSIKEVRKAISSAEKLLKFNEQRTILFIDEIHRFNKAQQDAFLPYVENGTIILIGATTENPSFEVISPLISRCQVIKLKPLKEEEIVQILRRAKKNKEVGLGGYKTKISLKSLKYIARNVGGDTRAALNVLETAIKRSQDKRKVSFDKVKNILNQTVSYDKKGEHHYNTISAFIKSIRGSDPSAALHYLAKMIEGGEDPKLIARRMIILASEDIGNADPHSLMVASSVFQAVERVGLPEAGINLAQGVTYLASAPKSNASYKGYLAALKDVKEGKVDQIPLKLRNAVTDLMKELEYGKDYKYAHDEKKGYIEGETYLPDNLKNKKYYQPKMIGFEKKIKDRFDKLKD